MKKHIKASTYKDTVFAESTLKTLQNNVARNLDDAYMNMYRIEKLLKDHPELSNIISQGDLESYSQKIMKAREALLDMEYTIMDK